MEIWLEIMKDGRGDEKVIPDVGGLLEAKHYKGPIHKNINRALQRQLSL